MSEETRVQRRRERQSVLSVSVSDDLAEKVDEVVRSDDTGWCHLAITGAEAEKVLAAGHALRKALSRHSGQIKQGEDLRERAEFSAIVGSHIKTPCHGDRWLVAARSLVPLDLVSDGQCDWGDHAVFSHVFPTSTNVRDLLHRAMGPQKPQPLGSYLLMCPMEMDQAGRDRWVPRHMQDIMTVALGLEGYLPVEVWLQPSFERAMMAFSQPGVSWLHIDTHGDPQGIMLGPSRDGGRIVDASELPARVSIPFVLVVGCDLTAGAASVGAVLFERGVEAVFGPCASFQSVGVAGSEAGEAEWYRNLFASLLEGADIGESLLIARRAVSPGRILKHAYLIVGSSSLAFGKA